MFMFMFIFCVDKPQFYSRPIFSDVMTVCQALIAQPLFLRRYVLLLLLILTYYEDVPQGDSRIWESPNEAGIV